MEQIATRNSDRRRLSIMNERNLPEDDADKDRPVDPTANTAVATILQPADMSNGELELHEAARKNSLHLIKKHLENASVDVNVRNSYDRTALHFASANGHIDVMKYLIGQGAELEISDKFGMNALLWAAQSGHVTALKYLIGRGSDVMWRNKQGASLLHIAIANDNLATVQYICTSVQNFYINTVDNDNKTSLHHACALGRKDIVDELLTSKVKLDIQDKKGNSPLHLASENGFHEICDSLFDNFIHSEKLENVWFLVNQEGYTALHLASSNGHYKVCQLLLEQYESCLQLIKIKQIQIDSDIMKHKTLINVKSNKGVTSLHLAAKFNCSSVCGLLTECDARLGDVDNLGNSALHMAAEHDSQESARILLQSGIDPNLKNQRGETALHTAVCNGFTSMVTLFLVHGAVSSVKDKLGRTCLQLASRSSFVAIVDILIKSERYRQSNEKSPLDLTGKPDQMISALLWKLSTKQLRINEWKKMANYWNFLDEQIKAIEHQYTGGTSYKEHGYRMLLVWYHGAKDDFIRQLFEALVKIGRKKLAEKIRRDANLMLSNKPDNQSSCILM